MLLLLARPSNLAHQGGAGAVVSAADLLKNSRSRREAADAQLGILGNGR